MKNISEIIESLDGDELCEYCRYSGDCSGGVHGGPNGPIYPPCADRLDEADFDLDTYLEDLENDEVTE